MRSRNRFRVTLLTRLRSLGRRLFPISPECEENAAERHDNGEDYRNIPKHLRTLAKRRSFEVATSNLPPNSASFLCEMKDLAPRS